jgi:hypothetical protein
MANYVANKTVSVDGSPATILAALKTALELQDSTNNPIKLIDILESEGSDYFGVLVTTGTIV